MNSFQASDNAALPPPSVSKRPKRVLLSLCIACGLIGLAGIVLQDFDYTALGWSLRASSRLMFATLFLCLALVYRRRPVWLRGNGAPKCTKCKYPIEAQYAVCPECGLALTPEKVEASRYVWMDTKAITISLVIAAIGYSGAFMALRLMLRAM